MRILLGFFALLLTQSLFAQLEPVKWTAQVEKISDQQYEVSLTADIDQGWAIYSQEVSKDLGPIPTQLKINQEDGIVLIGDIRESGMKKQDYDSVFGFTVPKFQRKARFSQIVHVEPDTTVIRGQLTFMTCDATSCLPPAEMPFEITIEP